MKNILISILLISLNTNTYIPVVNNLEGQIHRKEVKIKTWDEKIKELQQKKLDEDIKKQLIELDKAFKKLKEEELEKQKLKKKEVIYNPYNLSEPSNITKDDAYKILEGTKFQTLSSAYVYMEQLYGVNAIYLMSLSAEESGWGRSQLAITHNNIGGIKGSNGYRYFDSWGDCLNYKAKLLKDQYLSKNGSYFNGYSIWDVNEKYCEQKTWSENINAIANGLLNKLK